MFVISTGDLVDKYDVIKTKDGNKYISCGNSYLRDGDVWTSAIPVYDRHTNKVQIKVSDIMYMGDISKAV